MPLDQPADEGRADIKSIGDLGCGLPGLPGVEDADPKVHRDCGHHAVLGSVRANKTELDPIATKKGSPL
jgi:hypothetical protein